MTDHFEIRAAAIRNKEAGYLGVVFESAARYPAIRARKPQERLRGMG
jgi:hypothetical protein